MILNSEWKGTFINDILSFEWQKLFFQRFFSIGAIQWRFSLTCFLLLNFILFGFKLIVNHSLLHPKTKEKRNHNIHLVCTFFFQSSVNVSKSVFIQHFHNNFEFNVILPLAWCQHLPYSRNFKWFCRLHFWYHTYSARLCLLDNSKIIY